uniref:CDP-diacylglycerol--inositol 3-phosphatidyltransferase n=1 Tax=Pseudodiaptomus poplesia TaxID=213370 RepID=A0A0U2V9C7_9MAXI|nr:CDP-diacylglycerol--inositol 3-phosphatidyltransferase-like protein [Pseudodiaptomus poplesia]
MSSDLEKSFRELANTENVFMFVPNLIGYGRIFLALLSFWFMPTNYVLASWCYILSGLLDAVDGHAARMLGQSSKFGAMLDMLTDRCATMCLLATLCTFYPSFMFFFQLSMTIDISCHWIHLHTSLLEGKTSHKFMDPTGNWFMHKYYTDRRVLFAMCAGNELFYASIYLLNFTSGPFYMFVPLAIVTFPVAVLKLGIALLQGYLAAQNIAAIDTKERAEAKKE